MHDRELPDAADAAAARWVARLDRTPDDAGLRMEIAAWCDADPRRVGALLRARAVWSDLDDRADLAAPTLFSRRRMLVAGSGFAAAAAIAALVGTALERETAYSTAIGERRTTRLADGSTILLNTASRTHVALTRDRRRVSLDDGEAWFQVAKDRARPFVVSAGDVRIRAVGTAFAVRRLVGSAEVTVTEGRVRIWSVAAPERFLTLDAGMHAVVGDIAGAGQARASVAKPTEVLAWRKGEIVLDGMTLGDAAAEFNRYNVRKLAVEAPLAERRIVGWFRTDDVDGFARSAAAMTGARIERDDEDSRGDIRIVE